MLASCVLSDCVFFIGEFILLLQCTTYQLSCPWFWMCYVGYVCEIGQTYFQCGSFLLLSHCYRDAIGYNSKASNSVSLLHFGYEPYILFHTYDNTYLDANRHPAFQVTTVCLILTLVGMSLEVIK